MAQREIDAEIDALPEAVRSFRPTCPGCSPEKATDTEGRPCSFYDCPGLPAELKVTCDTCMFDFATGNGQIKCDHATCETAIRLRANVPTYRTWVELVTAELRGHS